MNRLRKSPRGCLASLATVLAMTGLSGQLQAATPLVSFDFNEETTDVVTDSVNGLTGMPVNAAPTSITETPSGMAGDRVIH